MMKEDSNMEGKEENTPLTPLHLQQSNQSFRKAWCFHSHHVQHVALPMPQALEALELPGPPQATLLRKETSIATKTNKKSF